MLLQGSTQLALIALSAVLTRHYDPTMFGQYAFGFQMATLMATVACMGSATAMAKSWGVATGPTQLRRDALFRIHNHMLIRGGAMIALSIPIFLVFSSSRFERTSYLIVFSLFVVMQQFNFFAATDRAPLGNFVQFSRAFVTLLVASIAIYFLTSSYLLEAMVVASSCVAFGCLLWNMSRHTLQTERPNGSDLRRFTYQHWMSVLMVHADIVIIRVFLDPESIAVFAVALFLLNACAFGLYAINANTIAAISDAATKMPRRELQAQLKYYAWIATGLSGIFIAMVVGIGQHTGLIFGPFYGHSYHLFLILLIGQVFNVLCGSVALVLNVFGKARYVSQSLTVALLLKLTISMAAIPILGVWGVAIGASVSMAFWNVYLLYVVRTRLGLNPSILPLAEARLHETPA